MILSTQLLSAEQVEQAAAFLLEGKIVAFPTETVYGLGAPIFFPDSIAKIFQIKKRPADNPLIAHISNLEQLQLIAAEIPPEVERLAAAFWPGPLTLICKRHANVPSIVSAGLDTIAIRMPKHPIALSLIDKVGQPLVAPSANLSGKPSPTQAVHVLEDLAGAIVAVIDGGCAQIGIESTVLNLLGEKPTILRPGAITELSLQEVLQVPVGFYVAGGSSICSPGMKYRHYAPVAPLRLFFDRDKLVQYLSSQRGRVLLLTNDDALKVQCSCDSLFLNAQTLYSHLRHADVQRYEQVLIYCDAQLVKDRALMDRLMRAAAIV
jgi:L-threonylcarbamoyladenylate synthase